jgi:predicted extracellular nuclease
MKVKTSIVLLLLFFVTSFILVSSPSKVKSAFDNVVINEVQIAGTVAEDEFVELYNPTAANIDITGWRLARNTESGASESNLVASLSGTVPAGGYFLVANDDFSGSVVPDQQYSVVGNNMASDNSVTLYSDAGVTIVDRVGFGSSTLFEGAAFATNPAASGSIERTQDTENNANDFVILDASTPMNSLVSPTPTVTPTATPTEEPSPAPTETPTESPTASPSPKIEPTEPPSPSPTITAEPTEAPTPVPTEAPEGEQIATFFTSFAKVECRLASRSFGFLRMLLPVCRLVSLK